jgi:hypothetical protein
MSGGQPEFGLVMPFVTVQSKGGPHDDDSYVAGFQMGGLDANLKVAKTVSHSVLGLIRAENRDQADLIAMKHGFNMRITTDTGTGWLGIVFTNADEVSEGTE